MLTIAIGKSQKCANCAREDLIDNLKQCSSCKETLYCSKTCQNQHWTKHKEKCTHLKVDSTSEKLFCTEENAHSLPSLAQVCHPHKVTSLVGRQCLVECHLNHQHLQALWDTGSQVSVIDERWKEESLPNARLRDVSEILDSPD